MTSTRTLLRVEGAAALLAATWAYAALDQGWIWFAALFLVPDAGMAGYLVGPRLGAITYNLCHTYPGPLLLAGLGWYEGSVFAVATALIWVAHIGFDRLLGYGLKEPEGFHSTHLGRIGSDLSSPHG